MRPPIVLFGDSITQRGFANGGWAALLADFYTRTVRSSITPMLYAAAVAWWRAAWGVRRCCAYITMLRNFSPTCKP